MPARFEVAGKDVRIVVDDTHAAYPVRIDPYVEAARLTFGVFLGEWVAVSSDGSTVVVGAPREAGVGKDQGAVYVFKEPASGWANVTQTAMLTASDGGAGDTLGSSVAVSSDGAAVVAGAPYATVGANPAEGAVYVFKEPASGWADGTQAEKFADPDGAAGERFGFSVAMSPDTTTLVASAVFATVGGQGVVYVLQNSLWKDATDLGNGWEQLNWFGSFYLDANSSPWIYHGTLGWLYPAGTSTESIWFYDPRWDGAGGWWWTGSSFFPWIYTTTENEWLYYDADAAGARWFFNAAGQASMH